MDNLLPLNFHRNVVSLLDPACSSEFANCVPPALLLPRCTYLSTTKYGSFFFFFYRIWQFSSALEPFSYPVVIEKTRSHQDIHDTASLFVPPHVFQVIPLVIQVLATAGNWVMCPRLSIDGTDSLPPLCPRLFIGSVELLTHRESNPTHLWQSVTYCLFFSQYSRTFFLLLFDVSVIINLISLFIFEAANLLAQHRLIFTS